MDKDPRRPYEFYIHHDAKVDINLVQAIRRAWGLPPQPARMTEEEWGAFVERYQEKNDWRHAVRFGIRPEFHKIPGLARDFELTLMVRQSTTIISDRRKMHFPPEEERWNWVKVAANFGVLQHQNTMGINWFLEFARQPFEVLRPDFAFSDLLQHIAKHAESGPRRFAWPALYLAPSEVTRIGRETVFSAPAWKVEEVLGGDAWIQAVESPYLATKKMLKPLAAHLGLEVPR